MKIFCQFNNNNNIYLLKRKRERKNIVLQELSIWKAKFLRKDCRNNLSSEDGKNNVFFVHRQFISDFGRFLPNLFLLHLKVKNENKRSVAIRDMWLMMVRHTVPTFMSIKLANLS